MDKVNHTTYLCVFFYYVSVRVSKAACAGFRCGRNLERVAIDLNGVSLLEVSDVFTVCWLKASA